MTRAREDVSRLLRGNRPWEPLVLPEPVPVDQLPTPVLLLDRSALERNIATMADWAADHGVGVRPHAKTHKCPVIAHLQMAAGAVGVCVAKLTEAEVFLAAGVRAMLVTSPVVTDDKIDRLIQLMGQSGDIWVVVDSEIGVRRLSAAAGRAGIVAGVLVDLDPDMGRTGVPRGERALALARLVNDDAHLRLHGLQQYCGNVMHIEGYSARAERSRGEWQQALETRDQIVAAGIEVNVVSGGGTGTFDIDCHIDGITDLQVGSYIFMDNEYRLIGGPDSDYFDAFAPSLFVETTAISAPRDGFVTLDGGFKCMVNAAAPPVALDLPETTYYFGGDEHGILRCTGQNAPPALGDRVRLLTPHCDPTVNLHDYYCVFRDGLVEELWPVAARGPGC